MKTETILNEDGSIYGEFDYIDFLEFKIRLIKGEILEKLYFKNEHGGMSEIDEFGCSDYNYFKQVSRLYKDIVQLQMAKRIKKQ